MKVDDFLSPPPFFRFWSTEVTRPRQWCSIEAQQSTFKPSRDSRELCLLPLLMTSRFSGKRRPCIQSFWTPCLLQEGCTALQNLWKKKKTGSQRCIANYRVWRRANHQASIFLLKWMCERNLGCVEENFRFLLLLVFFLLFLTFSSSFFCVYFCLHLCFDRWTSLAV